jgi:predicted nucleic acid-binding protein
LATFQSKDITEYILDTSVLILLFEKCHLREELLKFSKTNALYVPSKVEAEYFRGNGTGEGTVEFKQIFKSINPTLENDILPYFNFQDEFGEVWVISYAIKNPNCYCVIDEQLGRNVCDVFNLKLTGTVGIIDQMKKLNYFSNEKMMEIRQTIRTCGFYLSKEMCKELDRICLGH